jgi:tRNA-dihydrouridine synthase B
MFLNYVAQNVDADGQFLRQIRQAQIPQELFAVCDRTLLQDPQHPFALSPYPSPVVTRPTSEASPMLTSSQTPFSSPTAVK